MTKAELAFGGADRARSAARRSLRNVLLALVGVLALRRATRSTAASVAVLLGYFAWSAKAKVPQLVVPGGPKHDPLIGGLRHVPALADCFLVFWMKVARSTGFKTCELTLPGGKRLIPIHDERDRKSEHAPTGMALPYIWLYPPVPSLSTLPSRAARWKSDALPARGSRRTRLPTPQASTSSGTTG